MFNNPMSVSGRIRRTEFGISFIIAVVANLFVTPLAQATDGMGALLIFPVVFFLWTQGAKRSHDVGNSGWFILIPFYALYLLFKEGDRGTNQYGKDPKE